MYNKSILKIVNADRCVHCGACKLACHTKAIDMTFSKKTGFYMVNFEKSKCCNCGSCLKICPAYNNELRKGDLLGSFKSIFLAYTTDYIIREKATSGGIVNEICRYLIEEGEVDGAIMAKLDANSPTKTYSYVITSSDDLKNNPRDYSSRYISIPITLALNESEIKNNKKYAIVGTPCQIKGMRRIFGDKHIYIGLACSEGISWIATQRFLNKINIDNTKIQSLYYRGEGWPGYSSVITLGGENIEQEHYRSDFNSIYSSQIYRAKGCRYCHDQFAEEADISCFDFWNDDELKNETVGKTGVIIRTDRGKTIIDSLIDKGRIAISKDLSATDVSQSQLWILLLKKKYWNHFVIRSYYKVVDIIRLLGLDKHMPISVFNFLSKCFRKVIYMLDK